MKKSLIFAAILCLGVFSGLILGIGEIMEQKNSVEISHQVLEGDPVAVEGLTLRIATQWTGRLFWDTEVTFAENAQIAYDTEFFSDWAYENQSDYLSLYWDFISQYGDTVVSLWYSNGYHSSTSAGYITVEFLENIDAAFEKAVADVVSRTPDGESHTEVVTLADYEEYYPLCLDILNVGNLRWHNDSDGFFTEYFGIKIPETHKLSVTISKRGNGAIYEIITEDKGGAVNIECFGAEAEDGVYFTYCLSSEGGNNTDIEVKSGNGIFFIPLEQTDPDSTYREVHYKQLQKVFVLPEQNCESVDIKRDNRGNILLLTNESDALMLRVIDEKNMAEKSKMKLLALEEGAQLGWMKLAEEYLFVLLTNGFFCYLTYDGQCYEPQITDSLGEVSRYTNRYRDWAYGLDYQDGRLAVAWSEDRSGCGVYVYVFNKEGLEYKGHIRHSADYEEYYDYNSIFLQKEGAVAFSFAK